MTTEANKVVEELLAIARDVNFKKRNPREALVTIRAYEASAKAAARISIHQQMQKKVPNVPFFDKEIPE